MVRRHGGEDGLGRDQSLVLADVGPEPDDVRSAILVDRGDHADAALMLGLHRQQYWLEVGRDVDDIDQLVMTRAHQHQVLERTGQLRRARRIAAWPIDAVSDDMGDEAEGRVLPTRDEVADEILVAAAILASAAGSRPQRRLHLRRDRRLSPQAASPCRPVPVPAPEARQPS